MREAQASCVVQLGAAFEPMAANAIKKGDVVPVATLAGIQVGCGLTHTAQAV